MDISTIFGLNYNNERSEMAPAQPTNLYDELVRKRIGVKTDALSAVKLDPAVLEAQVTIEAAPDTADSRPHEAVQEQITEQDETKINMVNSDGKRYVRRPVNNAFNYEYTRSIVMHGGGNIKVWGCFSGCGVGPVRKIEESLPLNLNFEETLTSMHRNALLNLTSQQFALLMIYVNNLRKQRVSVQNQNECAFCKNNGQSVMWYTSHALRDRKGRVRCPMLRALQCPRCGDTGDRAHTIKYCPNNNYWRS